MLESFLTVLGSLVANKKVVAAWLILLSAGTAQIGSKVYSEKASKTTEIAIINTKLDAISEKLDDMSEKTEEQTKAINALAVEMATLKAEKKNGKK